MKTDPAEAFRGHLLAAMQDEAFREPLQASSLAGQLGAWTRALTGCVASACLRAGWRASAKGAECELLPVRRSEYLGLDVMAFAEADKRWLYPTAILELENSADVDKVAYALWKVLCVRADLRILFCYRKQAAAAPALVQHLRSEVIEAMTLQGRVSLHGRTFVVVGSRADAATFPFGFFKWWELNTHTGRFELF